MPRPEIWKQNRQRIDSGDSWRTGKGNVGSMKREDAEIIEPQEKPKRKRKQAINARQARKAYNSRQNRGRAKRAVYIAYTQKAGKRPENRSWHAVAKCTKHSTVNCARCRKLGKVLKIGSSLLTIGIVLC